MRVRTTWRGRDPSWKSDVQNSWDGERPDERVLWAEEPAELDAVLRAISARDDKSHKLWTDDYLAAFAQTSGATLATLDRQLASRYPSVRVESPLPA
jgi:predicted nucleic acid-binding protein